MNKNCRKKIDTAVRHLFRVVSWFSVVALVAMLVFVFYKGVIPFISPTAESILLVAENIDNITVNGKEYSNHRKFIPLDEDADSIRIEFINRGSGIDISLKIIDDDNNPNYTLLFPPEVENLVSNPELDNYTITYPGIVPGLEQRIHIIIPEPPYSVPGFLFGSEWRPVHRKLFGILPMIAATFLTTLGAVLIGVPVALLSALLISEFFKYRFAGIVQGAIDLLAGIPSVVYGFFGLMIVVPAVQRIFGSASGSSLIAAVLVLAVMILPTVVSITITSLKAVPDTYREASLALGATRMQTAWSVVFPAAKSGIIASIILGTSRAIGETMAVILVAGNSPQFPSALTDSVRTMTATIALEMGYSAGRHNQMLFSIGIILFVIIFVLNGIIMKLKHHLTEIE